MQDKRKLAIEVDNVQKIYKLYDKPSDRLKEAFGFGKKTKHKLHYALKGVSMKIYQGETVGIIGTNMKEYLAANNLKQKQFLIQLIESALEDTEKE